MPKEIQADTTNQSAYVRILDATDGSPEQAITSDSTNIAFWYRRAGAGKVVVTAVTLVTLTSPHTNGAMYHIDDGYYRVDVPDGAYATGATDVLVGGQGDGLVVIGDIFKVVTNDPNPEVVVALASAHAKLDTIQTDTTIISVQHASAHAKLDIIQADTTVIAVDTASLVVLANSADGKLDVIQTDTTLIVAASAQATAVWEHGARDLTSATNFNDISATDVSGVVEAMRLDELFVTALSAQPTAGSFLGDLTSDNAGTQQFTTAALEHAPSGSGSAATAIATAVWEHGGGRLTTGSTNQDLLSSLVVAVITDAAGTHVAADIIAAKTQLDVIQAVTTLIAALNDISTTDVSGVVEAHRLDELFVTALSAQPTAGSFLGDLTSDNAGTQQFTTAALEHAPSGSGSAATAIATAVWEHGGGRLTTGSTNQTLLSSLVVAVITDAAGTHVAADIIAAKTQLDVIQTDTTIISVQHASAHAKLDIIQADTTLIVSTSGVLEAMRLDELFVTALSAQPTAGSMLADLTSDNAGTQQFTTNALELSPSGGALATAIATAVWEHGARDGVMHEGTAQTADASSISIASGHGLTAGDVDNCVVYIQVATAGVGQMRVVTSLTGDKLTISPDWATIPTSTVTAQVFPAPPLLASMETRLAELDAGNLITDVANVKSDTASLIAAVITDAAGTNVAADIVAAKTQLDVIQADTTLIVATSGVLEAMRLDELFVTALSAQPTAGSILGDLTSDDAGTQQFTTNSLELAPLGSGVAATAIATAVWEHGTRDITSATNFNDISTTDVSGVVEAMRLDELFVTALSAQPTAGSILGDLTSDDAGTQQLTTNALEHAPSGSGSAATAIATAVWEHGARDLSSATNFNDLSTADVSGVVEAMRLDELFVTALSAQPTAGSFLGDLTSDNAGTQQFTTNSLEHAPSGSGSAATAIATAVWEHGGGRLTTGSTNQTLLSSLVAAVIDDAAGTNVAADIIAAKAQLDVIQTDTTLIANTLNGVSSILQLSASLVVAVIDDAAGTNVAADIAAVKVETASLVAAAITDAAGTNVAADIAAVKVETASLVVAVVDDAAGTNVAADIIAAKTQLDVIQADTTVIAPQFASLVAAVITDAAGSNVAADVIAAKTQLDVIQADTTLIVAVSLIAAATWDKARTSHIAAGTFGESYNGVVNGAAQTGTLSTTQMSTDLSETTNDHYIGRTIIWLTGDLAGQASDVTDYVGTNGVLTFTAVTDVPGNGDRFVMV